MNTAIWVLSIVAVLALAAGGVLQQRRYLGQVRALSDRLASLEARWLAEVAAPPPPPPAEMSADTVHEPADEAATPSSDVLAGLTSHVQRLLAAGQSGLDCLADRAILVIYRDLSHIVTPVQVADGLHVSLRTLERGLALGLKCTPGQLVAAVKMREARRLLEGHSMRVAEVASRLGFADPFHFSRRYKAFYGVAPSEARRVGRG